MIPETDPHFKPWEITDESLRNAIPTPEVTADNALEFLERSVATKQAQGGHTRIYYEPPRWIKRAYEDLTEKIADWHWDNL